VKATVWVLNVGNYRPDICEYTLPSIKRYAEKIGADYQEITERKFPEYPLTLEKLQIHELGKNQDVNILIDADILISPKTPNIFDWISYNKVLSLEQLNIRDYFQYDPVFMNLPVDREISTGKPVTAGPSGNFIVTTKSCHDLWKKLDLSPSEIKNRTSIEWLVDEYTYAYNMARYNYRSCSLKNVGFPDHFIYHAALTSGDKSQENFEGKLKEFSL
jgi:hypothetical protein